MFVRYDITPDYDGARVRPHGKIRGGTEGHILRAYFRGANPKNYHFENDREQEEAQGWARFHQIAPRRTNGQNALTVCLPSEQWTEQISTAPVAWEVPKISKSTVEDSCDVRTAVERVQGLSVGWVNNCVRRVVSYSIRFLQKLPGSRFQTMSDVREALQRAPIKVVRVAELEDILRRLPVPEKLRFSETGSNPESGLCRGVIVTVTIFFVRSAFLDPPIRCGCTRQYSKSATDEE